MDAVYPAKLVGQGRKEGAMTDVAQENTLRRFRLGQYSSCFAREIRQYLNTVYFSKCALSNNSSSLLHQFTLQSSFVCLYYLNAYVLGIDLTLHH